MGTFTFDIHSGVRSREHGTNNLMSNLKSKLVVALYSSSSLITIDKSKMSSRCFFVVYFYSLLIRNRNFCSIIVLICFQMFYMILHKKMTKSLEMRIKWWRNSDFDDMGKQRPQILTKTFRILFISFMPILLLYSLC